MKQTSLSKERFEEMEKNILKQIMNMSKALLEIFKFKMIYSTKVSSEQDQQTIQDLKEFRAKNEDSKLSRKELYDKYSGMY